MGREELLDLVRSGPVRVTMNDGSVFEIPNLEFCLIDDLHAYVLLRDNGRMRTKMLALVNVCTAEHVEAT